MPHSSTAIGPTLPNTSEGVVPGLDRRARQLGLLIRGISLTAAPIGGLEMLAGLAFGEPRAIVLGLAALAYATWLLRLTQHPETLGQETTVTRIASVTLGLIAAAAMLEPTVAIGMAIAALLPGVLVLPFLSSGAVGRVLTVTGVVGIGSVVAGQVVPPSERIPTEIAGALAFATLVLAYGFLMLFLWDVSRRLKATTNDLRSVIAMSNDLSRTMDPQLVGDRIVRHIAKAVGASESALCYWDRPTDRLVTMGCYPPERSASLLPWYPLADYPATRQVLETSVPTIVDAADPSADPNEVAYLASIGMRSMAMVPLIAAGNAVGTLELMSERSGVFRPSDLDMATMLAGEGAMALANARLYEEIRHQALHDGLTGLANRVLFRDRVANAIERGHDRDGRQFAILFIDLDDFKALNDTLGHALGDDVLIATAGRVADSLRPSDTAARLGGDGVSTDTVRFYERSGWLPRASRRDNEYREYGKPDVEHLRLLIDLRRLDVPLEDAARIAGWCHSGHCADTTDELPRLIGERRAEIADRIAGLQALDARIAGLELHLKRPRRSIAVLDVAGPCCEAADAVVGSVEGACACCSSAAIDLN